MQNQIQALSTSLLHQNHPDLHQNHPDQILILIQTHLAHLAPILSPTLSLILATPANAASSTNAIPATLTNATVTTKMTLATLRQATKENVIPATLRQARQPRQPTKENAKESAKENANLSEEMSEEMKENANSSEESAKETQTAMSSVDAMSSVMTRTNAMNAKRAKPTNATKTNALNGAAAAARMVAEQERLARGTNVGASKMSSTAFVEVFVEVLISKVFVEALISTTTCTYQDAPRSNGINHQHLPNEIRCLTSRFRPIYTKMKIGHTHKSAEAYTQICKRQS
jgi:hypothetical protein